MSRDGGRPGQPVFQTMASTIRREDSPMSRDPRGGSPSLPNNDPKQPLKSCLKRGQSPFGSGPGRPNEPPFGSGGPGRPNEPPFGSGPGRSNESPFGSISGRPSEPPFGSDPGRPNESPFGSGPGRPNKPPFVGGPGRPNEPSFRNDRFRSSSPIYGDRCQSNLPLSNSKAGIENKDDEEFQDFVKEWNKGVRGQVSNTPRSPGPVQEDLEESPESPKSDDKGLSIVETPESPPSADIGMSKS